MSKRFSILRPFGVEITRVDPTLKLSSYDSNLSQIRQDLNSIPDIWDDYLIDGMVKIDPGCVEFSSVVLFSYEELEELWNRVEKASRRYRLEPNSKFQWGGGGHVTVNLEKPGGKVTKDNLYRFKKKMMRFLVENPYICWAFGDPGDNHTAVLFDFDHLGIPVVPVSDKKLAVAGRVNSDVWPYREACIDDQMILYSTKGVFNACAKSSLPLYDPDLDEGAFDLRHHDDLDSCLVNSKRLISDVSKLTSSVEYRFFGTAVDWEMQVAHVEFAQAMTEWVINGWKAKHDDTMKNFKTFKSDKNECKKSFKALIKKLGLSWPRYKRFLEYLDTRFDVYGKEYLT